MNLASVAGLSEEDAELLAPTPKPASVPSGSGKADAAWEEESDFPNLADPGAAKEPALKDSHASEGSHASEPVSNGTPATALATPPADAAAQSLPAVQDETEIESLVSF